MTGFLPILFLQHAILLTMTDITYQVRELLLCNQPYEQLIVMIVLAKNKNILNDAIIGAFYEL